MKKGQAQYGTSNVRLSQAAAKTAASILSSTANTLSAAQFNNGATLSTSSSNLLSPQSHIFVQPQHQHQATTASQAAMLKQMQKKYSKSVDCTHYLDKTNETNTPNYNLVLLSSSPNSGGNSSNKLNTNLITTPVSTHASQSNLMASQTNLNLDELNRLIKLASTDSLQKPPPVTNSSSLSYSTKIQRQQSNNSPLIPRRADYEPMTRVTIQRQQRVSELSPTNSDRLVKNFSFQETGSSSTVATATTPIVTHTLVKAHSQQQPMNSSQSTQHSQSGTNSFLLNRPITLDLKQAYKNSSSLQKQNDSIGLSTASTNEDDFLVLGDDEAKKQQQQMLLSAQNTQKKDSSSLSLSSSSVPTSSSSPMTTSPRLLPKQPQSKTLLTPTSRLKSQSSTTSS